MERGRCTELVALPAFYDSHLHILDYGLAGLASLYDPEELLPWPTGAKARLIAAGPCAALRYAKALLERMPRLGWGGATVFLEAKGPLCRLVKLLGRRAGLRLVVLGRGEAWELEGCDGLGAPHLETRLWVRRVEEARARGMLVGVHVSETRGQALLDDYNLALLLRPHHVVHLTHAPPEAHEALLDAGVYPVYCPASNAILWGDEPPMQPMRFLLGSDNAGWSPLDPWALMNAALSRLRRLGVPLREAARAVLQALTVNAWRAFGAKPPLLVLHAPQVVRSVDPAAALVLTSGVDQVVGLADPLAHLEAEG